MTKQKTAVCNTLISVLKERGVDYKINGETTIKSVLTTEDKAKVRAILLEGFLNNTIEMSEQARTKHDTEAKMKVYVNGLVNNWIKKNPEFNNGQKYVPANPGSRAGNGDDKIKAMRALLKGQTDPEVIAEINEAITARLAEIKPAKAQAPIDVEALPEHLRHLAE